MELLIEPWLVSLLPPRKWEKDHMPFSVVTTQHKLSEELMDLRPLKISRTGLVLGLLKVKVCTMVKSQCKHLVRTHLIQPSLILDHPNFLSHQMFSIKLEKNGNKPFQTLIALQIRLSATSRIPVRMLLQN